MLAGSCHCGAIRIEVNAAPPWLIDCNCSICRRYGALWALYEPDAAKVIGLAEDIVGYVWGAKTITTLRCRHCGCITHWEPLQPGHDARVGVNTRMFDPQAMASVPVRRFDGAHAWAYID